MSTLAKIYYVGQIVAALILSIAFCGYAVRGIIEGADAFVIVLFAALSVVSLCMMFRPGLKDYKAHKASQSNECSKS